MSSSDMAAAAAGGPAVAPVAYLVVAGQYDDRTVLCVCANEGDAAGRADRWNLANFPSEDDAAHVEPVEYVPARAARVIPPESAEMSDGMTPVIPAAGSHRPGAVSVRLVCPPDALAAAMASLSGFYGAAWQPSTRKPARNAGGHQLQYGTLIVPVPTGTSRPPGRCREDER